MSPRSWHTLVPLKTKGRMLGVREVKHETDVSKSSKNYWIAGIPTAQKHDLGLCLSLTLSQKNFKNHLSRKKKKISKVFQSRADLAFFNTYFYGWGLHSLLNFFLCVMWVQLWTFFKGLFFKIFLRENTRVLRTCVGAIFVGLWSVAWDIWPS